MKIFFTGASSFTGYWFAKTLAGAGHEVTAGFTRSGVEAYTDIYRTRVELLLPLVHPLWNASMGSESMLSAVKDGCFDLLCLHGAVVGNHKAPDFDVMGVLKQNTHHLLSLLTCFKAAGGRAVIATGTYFEADEGIGTEPRQAFSPYALSKTLTWQVIRFHCHQAGLRLAKFVVANPFGPLEKGGFTQYLITSWKKGEKVTVQTPDYVRDNVPVDLMALHYLDFCEQMGSTNAKSTLFDYCAPSGYPVSQGDFTNRFATHFESLTGRPAPIRFAKQTDFAEPMHRVNCGAERKKHSATWAERHFWEKYLSAHKQA
jgi:UDP-glucose 4-epimerase